jgi:hypothetical protein
VGKGYIGQLKCKVDYQVWKLKNNINNILRTFKKDDEELPF